VAPRKVQRHRRLVGRRLHAAGARGHRARRRRVAGRVLGGQHRRRRAPRHVGGERLPPRGRLDEGKQASTRRARAEAVRGQHRRRRVGARVHAAEVLLHRRADVHHPAGVAGAEQSPLPPPSPGRSLHPRGPTRRPQPPQHRQPARPHRPRSPPSVHRSRVHRSLAPRRLGWASPRSPPPPRRPPVNHWRGRR